MNVVPVNREKHAGQLWRRLTTYQFAARENYVPISVVEFGHIASSMPIGFVEQSGVYTPVAVLSFTTGPNLYVAPDGRWLGGYVPLMFRFYPFRLLRRPGTDQFSLWVDEDAQQHADAAASTELFYDAEGNLGPGTKAVFDGLVKFEQSRLATLAAVAALAAEKVICPWPVKFKDGEQQRDVIGIYRIDEVALNALSDEAFLRLRKGHALPIAFSQLLSMGQVANFGHLQHFRRQLEQTMRSGGGAPAPATPSSGSAFVMGEQDSLRFE